MDSINKQQPEQNHADLYDQEALEKLRELCEKKTCFFCTEIGTGEPFKTRPMSVQKIDEQGHLWCLSASDSHKNQEIMEDPAVQLLFQGSAHSDFVMLSGYAQVSKDKAVIKELWEPIMKVWFTEGVDDPRISVIEVTVYEGYYWDTKHGGFVAFVKQLAGAAMGKTLDDSIEGKIKL
ncbi:MAG: pyridoxamine 5'-phosphate oxidase family protein [Bacteroidetes bacterium]|nr:pyridoxamine 5'-phosphate oxidase family protein [Bacteroidota bacterium]